MVIEELPPPEPVVITPLPTTLAPKDNDTESNARHSEQHKEQTSAAPETTPETNEQSPPVPSLEPRESSTEQATQRREIQGLQDDVQKRIAKLASAGLSGVDHKTLDDARTFFQQSTQALNEGDLQRALMLARKASLLVSALEK